MTQLSVEMAELIADLKLAANRPTLILDADEVLFYFLRGFEDHLNDHGMILDLTSYALTGNIKEETTGRAISQEEVSKELKSFFETATHKLSPVEGAQEELESLSDRMNIVVLSNLPDSQRQTREETLAKHGMAYPVISNSGPKGPAVSKIRQSNSQHIVFVDDIPHHHDSVREVIPTATLIHFVADPRLAVLLPKAATADHRLDDWPAAAAAIHASLDERGL